MNFYFIELQCRLYISLPQYGLEHSCVCWSACQTSASHPRSKKKMVIIFCSITLRLPKSDRKIWNITSTKNYDFYYFYFSKYLGPRIHEIEKPDPVHYVTFIYNPVIYSTAPMSTRDRSPIQVAHHMGLGDSDLVCL